MQPAQLRAAAGRLDRFLGTLTPLLGRVERQTHASEYVRGLLLDGERALGKTANCQVAVSVHLGTDAACLPLTWGLYLPQAWIDDPVRRIAARVPDDVRYQTKNDLALAALDRVRTWGVGTRVVLANAGYGTSHDFRAALTARGLPYCVQVASSIKGWTTAPPVAPPYAGYGRPRRRPHEADIPPAHDLPTLAAALPATAWRTITWRAGTKARCGPASRPRPSGRRTASAVAGRCRPHPSSCSSSGRDPRPRQPRTGSHRSARKRWACAASCASPKAAGGLNRTIAN